ncbi:MAG: hypothetical protein AB8C95_12585, partial [Phycisphaeraceae bacterium]
RGECIAEAEDLEKQKDRLEKLKESIAQQESQFDHQKSRVDQIISNHQTKFNEEQASRTNQFTSITQKIEQTHRDVSIQYDEWTEGKDAEVKSFIDEQAAESQDLIDKLQATLDHATKLVGLIGNTGMAGHYQKIANREWWSATILQGLASVSFICMVVIVVIVVKDITANDFTWEIAIFRVAIALVLLGPAIYFATESSKHRQQETRNRRIELELSSIQTYLEDLPEEKTHAIIEELSAKYFGTADVQPENGKEAKAHRLTAKELTDLIAAIAKLKP